MHGKTKHPELISLFRRVFPRTVDDVIHNQITAPVDFMGIKFLIAPAFSCTCHLRESICPDCGQWARAGFPKDAITVWGDPYVNAFPA